MDLHRALKANVESIPTLWVVRSFMTLPLVPVLAMAKGAGLVTVVQEELQRKLECDSMCFNHKYRDALTSNPRRFSTASSYEGRQYITCGGSGLVYAVDNNRVLKQYFEDQGCEAERERLAYERLGSHPNIARYLGSLKDGCILLERGQPLPKIYEESKNTDKIPFRRKLDWLRQAAEGIRYVHDKDIVHADVGCYNMILTRASGLAGLMGSERLKLIDFAGASIDGGENGSCYQWYSYRPSTPEVSKQTDIFAFGCVVYEILTGRHPHHELENRPEAVKQLYQDNQFPDVANLPLGQLMQDCWHGTYNSMSEVVQALEAESMSMKVKRDRASWLIGRSVASMIVDMDASDDGPASHAGAHAMRAILPGRPRSERQAISTARWDGRRLVAYISGNSAIIATGPNDILQTLYINTETSLTAITIEESSGQIAVCGGKNIYVYRPIGSDEDVLLSWTEAHHLELDYAVTSLSWGSPTELMAGGARLVLWHLEEEKKVIWSQEIACPTALAIFSHDGGLLASCGLHDRMVKIWRRISYEVDSTSFDISYLPHPTSVTHLHWRKPWHSEMNLDSLLYTFCADNKIRVWAYLDPHSVSIMQMLTEIDIVSTIQPRRLSVGSTTPRRYAFIIDSRDFSSATEKAVSTAAPGVTDHALEHLIEVANRSPELCVVLDGLGHMSVWGLENAGWHNKNSTEVFNVAHVDDVTISLFQGEPHLQDYTQFYVFAGHDSKLSLLVHSYTGTISWYEASVTHLLDTAPRKGRVSQIASWAGHRHPINGVVKNDSGSLICSWTDVEVLVWRLTSWNVLQNIHSAACDQVNDALFLGDELMVLDRDQVRRYGHLLNDKIGKKVRSSLKLSCTAACRLLDCGGTVGVMAKDGTVVLPGTGAAVALPPGIGTVYPGGRTAVAVSADGRLSGLGYSDSHALQVVSTISTNIPNPAVVAASLTGNIAVTDAKQRSVSIWDSGSGTYEWTTTFDDTVERLYWHQTARGSHVLVVCFAFRILFFGQSRFTLLAESLPWVKVREIRIRDFTSHPIGALCPLDDASIVIGAGNQLFVLGPPAAKHGRPAPSTPAGLDLANSTLAVYSPEVINTLLTLVDFKSVDRILGSLQEQLKFFTDGDVLSSTLELSFDSLISTSDGQSAQSAKTNGTNGSTLNGHISLQDIGQRLKEKISQHRIPHLSSTAQSLLGRVADVAVRLEAHRASLDEHALRYLHALYTYDVETDLPWSAIVSASLSNCQEALLSLVIQFHGGKLTWRSARHSGIFLWLTDVEALRAQMENVARAEYTKHEDRNPVDCSLYYLALGKKHVLQLLWRQSAGLKERDMTMKLLANNFNEPRWKATALKNAFALLSKRRFEYAAAFFLLGGSLKDAVHTCVSQVKDLQLAVAIARVYYDSPSSQTVLDELVEKTVLRAAVGSEQGRWMATWAYQLLNDHAKAIQVLVRPVHECVGTQLDSLEGTPQSLNWKADDPLLAVLYVYLRDKLVKAKAWRRNVVRPGEETSFVLGCARFYTRMGIDLLAVRLIKNWQFVSETVEVKASCSLAEHTPTDKPVPRWDQRIGEHTKQQKPAPTQFVEPSADSMLDSFGF
ncbi:hypothetical protein DV738_g1608, partial [Chaetothyriales sp. CBS 135597]